MREDEVALGDPVVRRKRHRHGIITAELLVIVVDSDGGRRDEDLHLLCQLRDLRRGCRIHRHGHRSLHHLHSFPHLQRDQILLLLLILLLLHGDSRHLYEWYELYGEES